MSNVKERLLKFIKDCKISTAEFEREIGVSSGYVNSISKSLQPDKLERISVKFPDLDINWLLLGVGAMRKNKIVGIDIASIMSNTPHGWGLENFPRQIEVPEAAREIVERVLEAGLKSSPHYLDSDKLAKSLNTIPLNEKKEIKQNKVIKEQTRPRIPLTAAAGSLSGSSISVTLEQCEQFPVIHQLPSYDFTMFIKGDSMAPKYESGDEIACRNIDQSRFIQWGKPHVLDTTQGIIIKRVYEDSDKIRCVSYNPNYTDFSIPKEDIYSMSLVVGSVSISEM